MQTFTDTVQKGIQKGTTLGFPTVNIPLTDSSISGIYAGQVIEEGKTYSAAIFANQERKILEAYLLDFSGDLYGKEITIELHQKLREGMVFMNEDELKKQIAKDVEKAREYFKVNF